MTYTITYTPTAAKTLKKLDRQTARQIITAVDALQNNPYPPGSNSAQRGVPVNSEPAQEITELSTKLNTGSWSYSGSR